MITPDPSNHGQAEVFEPHRQMLVELDVETVCRAKSCALALEQGFRVQRAEQDGGLWLPVCSI